MKAALVELKVASSRGATWRKVVVQEDMPLGQLHRLLQYVLAKKSDEAIDKMDFAFAVNGTKVARPKSTDLNQAAGDAFLAGRETLTYIAAGAEYKMTAGKRAVRDAQHFVPRCIAGSADATGAKLDGINKKLLTTRFTRTAARNRQKKPLPKVYAPPWVSNKELLDSFLGQMRDPVDAKD